MNMVFQFPVKCLPHVGKVANEVSRMRRRVVRFEMFCVCTIQRLPLAIKGSCRRRRLKGSERCRFAERYQMARQNVHLLIPSVTASPCHRLAAARSRRGSDSPPGCHSMPRRRFATLVTKGRLENAETWQQLRNKNPSPHQSASRTASPRGEAIGQRKSHIIYKIVCQKAHISPAGGLCAIFIFRRL